MAGGAFSNNPTPRAVWYRIAVTPVLEVCLWHEPCRCRIPKQSPTIFPMIDAVNQGPVRECTSGLSHDALLAEPVSEGFGTDNIILEAEGTVSEG